MNTPDEFYQQLIKITIRENKKLNDPNIDYSKTYYQTKIPFQEDRTLNIRWIKIPTFIKENKQNYYAIFINDIEYWRAGEKKQLYQQIIETIDRHDVDSYTIFQLGKYYGHVDPVINDLMKYYNIYLLHKFNPEIIYKFIGSFLQRRIYSMKKEEQIFGLVHNDIVRLQDFVDFLTPLMNSNNVISNCYKNSFNSSYNKRISNSHIKGDG